MGVVLYQGIPSKLHSVSRLSWAQCEGENIKRGAVAGFDCICA